jgi:hypothetical protein
MSALSPAETRQLRLRAQRLLLMRDGAPSDAAELLRDLCGVQAQEPLAALLAVQVRSRSLLASQVGRLRVQERAIVRTWCMRGTLHLLAIEDLGWLLPLLGPEFVRKSRRRYAQLGLDEATCATAVRAIRIVLGDRGPMTRAELAGHLAELGIPAEGQAPYHLLRRAGLEGVICFGPDREGEPTYVALADWAPSDGSLAKEAALAELARRYLAAYGPARPEDLATWSGLSLRTARAGFESIQAELLELDLSGTPAWLPRTHKPWLDEPPPDGIVVRLLPGYDPYLLGYRGRDLTVPQQFAKRVHPGGGLLRPTLLVNGRAAGIWRLVKSRGDQVVEVEPFEGLGDEVMHPLENQVRKLGRFLEANTTLNISPPDGRA